MARYLFICGGTGQQIVTQRSLLNFDGFVQIDVLNQVIQSAAETRTQIMSLPVTGDNANTTTKVLEEACKDVNKRLHTINNEIKTITQKVSVISYLQKLEESGFITSFDKYLADVKELANATGGVPSDTKQRIMDFRGKNTHFIRQLEHDSDVQDYLRLKREEGELNKRLLAYQSGLNDPALGTALLIHGMAQRPLVGSAYFDREFVQVKFREMLQRLVMGQNPTPGGLIEIWIVSSMCGGTGQGISYHVAKYAEEFYRNQGYSNIVVQFVRLGAQTYMRYGTENSINENCAMATLHDAAFSFGVRPPINVPVLLGQPGAVNQGGQSQFNFYYLELVDYVGVDKNAVTTTDWEVRLAEAAKKRSNDLGNALRAIVNPQLQVRFNTSFVNVRPGWHRALYVRPGVWEKGVNDESLYLQTATQVLDVVKSDLYAPDYPALDANYKLSLEQSDSLRRWMSSSTFVEQITPTQFRQNGIRKQVLNDSVHVYRKSNPKELDVTDFISSSTWNSVRREMERKLKEYLGDNALISFQYKLSLADATVENAVEEVLEFSPELASEMTTQYIDEVCRAHRVIAKIDRQLAKNDKSAVGSLAALYACWNDMVPAVWTGNRQYEPLLRAKIKPFVDNWVAVNDLLSLRAEAKKRIEHARTWLTPLVAQLEADLRVAPAQAKLTEIRSLETLYDGQKTWLYVMNELSIRYEEARTSQAGLASAKVIFYASVVWGSRGLTGAGLRYVLGLPAGANVQAIVDEISAHCGREPEGIWWQQQIPDSNTRNPMSDFAYVIFPYLEPVLYQQILRTPASHGLVKPEIIMADDEYTGLKVLALQSYRGINTWFPQGMGAGVASNFYTTLVPALAPLMGETEISRQHRLAVASTGHPIYTTDHVHNITQNALVDRFSERKE